MATQLDPELERRIALMEGGAEQGAGFTGIDVFWLLLTGVVGPIVLLAWGWLS